MRNRRKTIRTLELTSPGQLDRAPAPSRLRFREVEDGDPVLDRTYREVGAPHRWSVDSWLRYGAPPARRHWLIEVEHQPAGVLTLLALPGDEVEIVSFGLLAALHGQGLGAIALTEAVDLAWTAYGGPVRRVWLHTNSFDHPRALPNYLKRGFQVVQVVERVVEVADDFAVRVLITGMSGTGTSSVVRALTARGHRAVDTDDGLSVPTTDGRQQWDERAIQRLLDSVGAAPLFVAGCEENQVGFYPQFDHIVLLTAPVEVLLERVATRTDNPFGSTHEQRRRILDDVEHAEPLLRRRATAVVDTARPLDEVVADVLAAVGQRTEEPPEEPGRSPRRSGSEPPSRSAGGVS